MGCQAMVDWQVDLCSSMSLPVIRVLLSIAEPIVTVADSHFVTKHYRDNFVFAFKSNHNLDSAIIFSHVVFLPFLFQIAAHNCHCLLLPSGQSLLTVQGS
uniref:Uncharacterized protein n=1 Tax=Arundo donax TaxID=35708 RepID=A0A0A9FMK3_ARUDO